MQHDCQAPRRQVRGHGRARRCLLKGCQAQFSPTHPLARYCSTTCRTAARRWSRWQAARRYRATEQGRACRRQQSCRYRERVRERCVEAAAESASCEGHQESADAEKIPCSRPGCYELFPPAGRSPLKKFCCALCRAALRRVRQREAGWRRRASGSACDPGQESFREPPAGFR
jgi:hypothetical protein